MRKQVLGFLILLQLMQAGNGIANTIEHQRSKFIETEAALRNHQPHQFLELKKSLINYPLYSYLDYWYLRKNLSSVSGSQVSKFLDQYPEQLISNRLRTAWLHQLGKHRDWDVYLRFYQPQSSVTLQCFERRARIANGKKTQALKDSIKLWLVGHSQPEACDPIFDLLYANNLINSRLIWKRIRLAFAENKTSLALYLSKKLSKKDRRWVKRWRHAHRLPIAAFAQRWANTDTPLVREILTHASKRLARQKPEQAWNHWQKLSKKHAFTPTQHAAVIQTIALHGALQQYDEASIWLTAVPDDAVSKNIRHWRIRNALRNQQWKQVIGWIDALPASEQQDSNWVYWHAYALESLGSIEAALTKYTSLSKKRNYFGFLAADRLGRPYQMNHEQVTYPAEELEQLSQHPGIERAKELLLIGKNLEARREWAHATASLAPEVLKRFAVIASQWDWHDRAILTAAQAKFWSDLGLRFPLPYQRTIAKHAARNNLDPALVFGVIRQESAFMEDANSPVGALGLMQLMPQTAKQTARALKIPYRNNAELLDSDHNIHLGTAYLGKLLRKFNKSPVLAAAAYNAGPHRVNRWLPKDKSVPAILWIESIPYAETRSYVRRVLAYASVFDWRLGRARTQISSRMPIVQQQY